MLRFGRRKGRFGLLKLPIMTRIPEDLDNVFYTRCISHNMPHAYGRLHQLEAGAHRKSHPDGLHDAWARDPLEDATFVGLRKEGDKKETTESEASHDGLRDMLLGSLAYRRTCIDISWFQDKAT